MRYGSACSGIEAATLAWAPLGWQAQWFSEIDAFASAVLAHHYPEVPNLGDLTKIHRRQEFKDAPIDLLVGGTPCQSFSVAGLRRGLADPRGNLALEFLRLVDLARPRWVVWENVPGVLSQDGGRAFGTFLGALGQLGYGWAYRVLDAQYFGLAQRRKRVFVIGHSGGQWARAAAVLFDAASLSGDPPPSREAGESATPPLAHSLRAQSQLAHRDDQDNLVTHALRGEGFDASEDGTGRGTPLVVADGQDARIASCLTSREHKGADSSLTTTLVTSVDYRNGLLGEIAGTIEAAQAKGNRGHGVLAFSSKDHGQDAGDLSPTIRAGTGRHANSGVPPAIAFHARQDPDSGPVTHPLDTDGYSIGMLLPGSDGTLTAGEFTDLASSLRTKPPGSIENSTTTACMSGGYVRRLTPRECERLQGIADDYTKIPLGKRRKPAKDSSRYRTIGNSMAVPVMHWIGERIALVDGLPPQPSGCSSTGLEAPE